MNSLHELCHIIPLPPEIVSFITSHLYYCPHCQVWDEELSTCEDCDTLLCLDCMKLCEGNCCVMCNTCYLNRCCPRNPDRVCSMWGSFDENQTWIASHPCLAMDRCTGCHRFQCMECDKYFCCNHHIELPSYNEPYFLCVTCWPIFRDRYDQQVNKLLAQM